MLSNEPAKIIHQTTPDHKIIFTNFFHRNTCICNYKRFGIAPLGLFNDLKMISDEPVNIIHQMTHDYKIIFCKLFHRTFATKYHCNCSEISQSIDFLYQILFDKFHSKKGNTIFQ